MSDEEIQKLVQQSWTSNLARAGVHDIAAIFTEHDLKHLGLPGHEYDRAMIFLYQLKDQ